MGVFILLHKDIKKITVRGKVVYESEEVKKELERTCGKDKRELLRCDRDGTGPGDGEKEKT